MIGINYRILSYLHNTTIFFIISALLLKNISAQTSFQVTSDISRSDFFLTHQLTLQQITQKEMLDLVQKKDFYLVDARTHEDFAKGHIPNAINLALDHFAADYATQSPAWKGKQPSFILYCGGPACHKAEGVALQLFDQMQPNLYLYKSGWEEWKKTHKSDLPK